MAALPPWAEEDLSRTLTAETIQILQAATQPDLKRNINTTSGLVGYVLAAPAAVVVPVMTPLLNELPREREQGIDIHHWKAITDLGWSNVGVYPGVVDQNAITTDLPYNVVSRANYYQSIATNQSITIQEVLRGKSLEGDIRAKRFGELIYALKLDEENWLTNASDYLWNPATPLAPTTVAGVGGATIGANTYYLSISAYNTNGETFATSMPTTVTTTGGSSTISCTVFTQPNATGYHIYMGTSLGTQYRQPAGNYTTPSGAELSQSILNMNGSTSFTLNAYTASGTALPAANAAVVSKSSATYGTRPLTFNGLMALVFGAGNSVYTTDFGAPSNLFTAAGTNAGTASISGGLGLNTLGPTVIQPAAANGKLSYSDIQTTLLIMYNQARANPDKMWVSPQDNQTVTNLLYNAAGTRYVITPNSSGVNDLVAGARVGAFLNPTTNSMIKIEVLPFLPQGTIIFGSTVLPYPVSGWEGPTIKVITNSDYMGFDFPPTRSNPVYGYQVLTDETLKITYLGGFGAITGIVAGTS